MRKTNICLAMLIALCVLGVNSMAETAQPPKEIHCKCCTKPAPYDGWKIGVQAWSFNRFSFYESLDKSVLLGLRYIEAYPGQKLGGDNGKMRFDHNLPANLRKEVKEKLADVNIKIVNYGVVGLSANEKDCRKVFDFAKDMSIETIISEPAPDALDLIDRLCKEYKIKVAIHNHPKPSRYWDPQTVLDALKGRSKWMGACPDTGHWLRSGLNPVDCLKKLKGKIVSVHLKDLNKAQRNAHDVPWGTGKVGIKDVLVELDRQNYKGYFAIEYEHNWENSVPDIEKCITYFNKVASSLNN